MATSRHTHNFRKCSHAGVGLAQARPNKQQLCLKQIHVSVYSNCYNSIALAWVVVLQSYTLYR